MGFGVTSRLVCHQQVYHSARSSPAAHPPIVTHGRLLPQGPLGTNYPTWRSSPWTCIAHCQSTTQYINYVVSHSAGSSANWPPYRLSPCCLCHQSFKCGSITLFVMNIKTFCTPWCRRKYIFKETEQGTWKSQPRTPRIRSLFNNPVSFSSVMISLYLGQQIIYTN